MNIGTIIQRIFFVFLACGMAGGAYLASPMGRQYSTKDFCLGEYREIVYTEYEDDVVSYTDLEKEQLIINCLKNAK